LINLHIAEQFDIKKPIKYVTISSSFVKSNRRFNVDLDLVGLLDSCQRKTTI